MVTTATRRTYLTIKTLVIAEAVGCFFFSYFHIKEVVESTGNGGAFAAIFPLMLDALAVLGFIGRTSQAFDASGKKAGTIIMVLVGTVSFTCNVLAGDNTGQRLFGALTVLLFVGAEWFASKLKMAPAPVIVEEAQEETEEAGSPLKGKKWTPEMKERARQTRLANKYRNADPATKRKMTQAGYVPVAA
jgi:Protein of unknown function (DUF2637)